MNIEKDVCIKLLLEKIQSISFDETLDDILDHEAFDEFKEISYQMIRIFFSKGWEAGQLALLVEQEMLANQKAQEEYDAKK